MENYKRFSQSDNSLHTIIIRCRSGDSSAFREIMEMHYRYTYAIAFRILHSETEAKNIVQETFVRVWKNISSYRTENKFTTWLYRIVVNLCYDKLKADSRQRKHIINFNQLRGEDRIYVQQSAERAIEMKDMSEKIIEIAQTLPPKQRLVFSLRDLQDFSLEEISQTTGISLNSVKANLSYARRYIRLKIEGLDQ